MKRLFLLFSFVIMSNCSFNNNSKFWTEDVIKKKNNTNDLEQILLKINDIMSLTFDEYKIYIVDYNKKSEYPDINEK
tara:strand:+ start:742 stop:972 length:231 start_codon:yes stop_codon:yes gene_type:complete